MRTTSGESSGEPVAPVAISRIALSSRSLPSPPVSAPPSPPPPPSPASPASRWVLSTPFGSTARPTYLLRRSSTLTPEARQGRGVFDLESSSPISPSGADKTILLARLQRASRTQVLLRDGQPARPLTEREQRRLEREEAGETSSSASGTGGESGSKGAEELDSVFALPSIVFDHSIDSATAKARDNVVAGSEENAPHASPVSLRLTTQGLPLHASGNNLSIPAAQPPGCRSRRSSRSTHTRSPPSFLPRPPGSSIHVDHSQAQATPLGLRSGFPGTEERALALKLAEAAAAQHTRHRGGPLARSLPLCDDSVPTDTKGPTSSVQRSTKAASRAATDPAPPSTLLGATGHSRAATAPANTLAPSLPTLPATSPRPPARSHTSPSSPTRSTLSFSSTSSQRSPLLLPVADASDPTALTLHFARRPDMSRKGSLGESWSRMCLRGDRSAMQGVFGSWSGASPVSSGMGMIRVASWSETEEDSVTEESGREGDDEARFVRPGVSEPSIFASPRSSFASCFFTSSSSRGRSLSSSPTPAASITSSPSSSPKLATVKLGGTAGPSAPSGRWEDILAASQPTAFVPLTGPARKPEAQSSRPGGLAFELPTSSVITTAAAQGRASHGGLAMKTLRAEQSARRARAFSRDEDSEAWESSSSEDADLGAEQSVVSKLAAGEGRFPIRGHAETQV